ncbi:MAG: hypothetical protein R2764_01060 [Bacteroidales bacterium]
MIPFQKFWRSISFDNIYVDTLDNVLSYIYGGIYNKLSNLLSLSAMMIMEVAIRITVSCSLSRRSLRWIHFGNCWELFKAGRGKDHESRKWMASPFFSTQNYLYQHKKFFKVNPERYYISLEMNYDWSRITYYD